MSTTSAILRRLSPFAAAALTSAFVLGTPDRSGHSLATNAARADAPATTDLPTEWHIASPHGLVRATGTLPESVTPTGDGRLLVVVDGGAGPAQIQIFDAGSLAPQRTIPMEAGVYGAPLADARGTGFWVSEGGAAAIAHIDAATGRTDRTLALPPGAWASSLARSPDGRELAVSDELGARLVFVDLSSGAVHTTATFGLHLADARYEPDGRGVWVANWGGASLFRIDARTRTVDAELPAGEHPEHLALSPDGKTLYATEADGDAVAVLDLATRTLRSAPIPLYGDAEARPRGISPTGIAVARDGTLYVACSSANALAVLRPDPGSGGLHLLGAVPTGWYPTAVSIDERAHAIDVADGMGESGRANPQYRPFARRGPTNTGYVASSMIGSVRRFGVPTSAELAAGTPAVRADGGPFLASAIDDPAVLANGPALAGSGASVLRPGGPIRHVIYVIKENRTYDQVLGDESAADGDPALTLFGRSVTPNQHAIAERFGIFDDTFADAEVSADGHNWSTAAYANDYLEKMWPPGYAGRRDLYDFEDHATASVPGGGYLWNLAHRTGVSLRNYGEFTSEPKERQPVVGEKAADVHDGITSSMPDLKDETDPDYPGFDLGVSDLTRFAEWKREYLAYERGGTMPSIELMRFPNDHTAGTRAGELTPASFVAQNDDAVGRLVDLVSHGPYWSSTAIFVIEDDAQNGADHVDAQRTTFYLASPYAAGGVRHAHYSTAGLLRTIEMIFGMPPMSAYDAAARPMTEAFTGTPDLRPFGALPETRSETERNGTAAYHARVNARLDLSREDAFPEAEMNDEIWHAVTGRAAPARPASDVATR